MKTYADTFKDKIIGLSEEELQNLRDSSFDKIEAYRERLAIVSNDKNCLLYTSDAADEL